MKSHTPEPTTDLRHFHRIVFKTDGVLTGNGKTWPCAILDLSLKGCLLRFNDVWLEDEAQTFLLTITLSEDVAIQMELQMSHVIGNTVGFKCIHIDLESISNLRRLVELNLGDSQILERDLLALSGVGHE